MNEYQQALMRIIELEDKNAELLEALEDAIKWHVQGGVDWWVDNAKEAIRKAVRFVDR